MWNVGRRIDGLTSDVTNEILEKHINELYVDYFFKNQGIGTKLTQFAVKEMNCDFLWVLEKKINAIRFYQRQGFVITEEKQYEEGTTEYIVKMKRQIKSV